jgi:hypothetical protein
MHHPIAQQEMMSVEKYRQAKQAENSQQINLIAALRPRRHILSKLLNRISRFAIHSERAPSSTPTPFEEAVDGT